jgi:hypothetical protein
MAVVVAYIIVALVGTIQSRSAVDSSFAVALSARWMRILHGILGYKTSSSSSNTHVGKMRLIRDAYIRQFLSHVYKFETSEAARSEWVADAPRSAERARQIMDANHNPDIGAFTSVCNWVVCDDTAPLFSQQQISPRLAHAERWTLTAHRSPLTATKITKSREAAIVDQVVL